VALKSFASSGELKSRVGEEIAISEWFQVTQERITQFADSTDDHQWIHTDAQRAARESPSGTTIAHGFLTLGLLAPLFATAMEIGATRTSINYGLNRVRFTAPVLANDRVRARFTLQDFTDLNPGAQLTWKVAVEREGGTKPVLFAEWIMRRLP
jgi:acyl dehydratase